MTTLLLLTFLAMVSVPYRPQRQVLWLIVGAAVVQLVVNVALPPSTPGLHAWLAGF